MIKIEPKGEGGYTVDMDHHFKLLVEYMAIELKIDFDYLLGCLLLAAVDKDYSMIKVERENNGMEGQSKRMGRR